MVYEQGDFLARHDSDIKNFVDRCTLDLKLTTFKNEMQLVLDQLRATIEENVKRHLDSKLDRDKYTEAEDRKASVRDVFRLSKKLD